MFFGESMFSLVSDASKVAFAELARQLVEWKFDLIDCQMMNPHLASLGVNDVSREQFLQRLSENQQYPSRRGVWTLSAQRWTS